MNEFLALSLPPIVIGILAGIACALPGNFLLLRRQALIGDVQNGKLSRVDLEKIDGEYQGASFPFIYNQLGGGVNRLIFDKQGTLWVGLTGRGWAAGEGLKKIAYTGKVPHEILHMKLTKTGFHLTFTKPVDRADAANVANYSLSHFELDWHAGYGTSASKQQTVTPLSAKVSADGREVTLQLPELLKEKIYSLHINGLDAMDGSKLEHPTAYYTLNRLKK